MEPSEYIQVDIAKGEENKFIIDTSIVSAFDKDKEKDNDYLKQLQEELELLSKALKNTTEKIKKNLEPCKKIKANIIKIKNQGINIPNNLLKNFKLCKTMRVRHKKLKEDFEYKKSQIEKLNAQLHETSVDVFDTKIVVKKPVTGYNKIIYKLSSPQREIKLKTDERTNKLIFKLIEDKEGILRIVNTN